MTGTNWVEIGGIAQLCAAGGTLTLAWFTRRLGRQAVEQAKATLREAKAVEQEAVAVKEQSELTRLGLEASFQPWITLGEPDYHNPPGLLMNTGAGSHFDRTTSEVFVAHREKENTLVASIAIRNVGPGLAIIDPEHSHIVGRPDPRAADQSLKEYTSATVAVPVVSFGQQTRVDFVVPLDRWNVTVAQITNSDQTTGELYLDIVFRDIGGYSESRARFHVCGPANKAMGGWIADSIEYFSPPIPDTPSTTVKFR